MSLKRIIKWFVVVPSMIFLVLYLSVSYSHSSFLSRTKSEVDAMYSSSGSVLGHYDPNQIMSLPEPVQKYFRYSLKEGRRYISFVRLKHAGFFRPSQSSEWMNITGEEYFSVKDPGYVWYAEIRPAPYVWIAARDYYLDGKGNVLVKLVSGINMVDSKGNETDQGAMVRLIGEMSWLPAALLPSEHVRWEALDERSAKVYFTDHGRTVVAVFHYNELGEATSFTAERFMDKSLEKFEGKLGNYREYDGVKIPTQVEAVWHLLEGDYSYANFTLTEIEYDVPEMYPHQKDL